MKFIVSSSSLLKQLQALSGVLNSNNALPILDNFLFELTKVNEEYLILEKVNFVHSGWFHFEVFENGKLIERNKFLVSKDIKKQSSN